MSPILVAISPHSVKKDIEQVKKVLEFLMNKVIEQGKKVIQFLMNKDIEQGKKVLEFLEQGYRAREKGS